MRIYKHDFLNNQTSVLVDGIKLEGKFLRVRGNFISVKGEKLEQIWNVKDGTFLGEYVNYFKETGLSPDGSDLVTLDADKPSQVKVLKICGDFHHIFDPHANKCIACPEPCETCIENGGKCLSCLPRFYQESEFKCAKCLTGCYRCNSVNFCRECD